MGVLTFFFVVVQKTLPAMSGNVVKSKATAETQSLTNKFL